MRDLPLCRRNLHQDEILETDNQVGWKMKVLNRVVALIAMFGGGLSVHAAGWPSYPIGEANELRLIQWSVCDIRFPVQQVIDQPFDLGFSARFTGPDGQVLNVPGFYDGGGEWVVRFSAPVTGDWSFDTDSTVLELKGKKGLIHVVPNTDPDRHGALVRMPGNPQRLYYEDGTPCTVLAFEADWLFALDYESPDGIPKTEQLLGLLESNGINQIVTTVYSYDVQWDKDPLLKKYPEYEYGGRDDIYPFLGSNKNPNFSSLNVGFFQKMDRMVAAMDELGITAHLMIYVWNKLVNWPDPETPEDNRYFDYIVKRYQAFPNVLWDVSKEALNNPRCTEAYGVERIHRIRALDAYKRLVTVHDGGFCQRNRTEVDFISWQIWADNIYDKMLEVVQKFPALPVFNIEHGGYERSPFTTFPGDYDDPEVCLRRNYLIMFAGSYSTCYWQGAAWNVLIHDPFAHDELPSPRFEYYRHLQEFFTRYPYAEFSPAPEDNRSGYCLKSEDTYLLYLPKDHYQVSAYGNNNVARDGAKATLWFNTLTGEYKAGDPKQNHFFQSPWRGEADSILIRQY